MKTFSLVKATIRGTTWFSTDGIRELARKERLWVLPVAGLGVLVALVTFMTFIVGMYNGLLAVGVAGGHPELVLFYGLLAAWAFVFLTSIPLALSVLYYSSDIRLLLSLPVKPVEIVGTKSALLYLYCLPVNLFFLIPAQVIYALHIGPSPMFIVAAVLHLLVTPVFPLSLSILLVLVLMKLVNLSRFRVALEVVGMVLGIFLILGLQVVVSRTAMGTMMNGTFTDLGHLPDVYSSLAGAFPPLAWAAESFLQGIGLSRIPLMIILTAAVCAAVFILAPINFLRDVAERGEIKRERPLWGNGSESEKTSAGRAGSGEAGAVFGGLIRRRSIRQSLLRREWAILSSNSTYLFEAFGEMLVLPLLLAIYALVLPQQIVGQAVGFITSSPLIGLIIMAVLVLMTNITTVSSTSLSREGKLFALSLTMPVAGREQLKAKLALHLLLFLPAYLVDLGIVYVLFKLPLNGLVFLIPAGPIFQVFGFMAGVFFDLKRPILKWTHPQQAMKSNMNAIVGMTGIFTLVVALAVPSFLILRRGFDPFLLGCLACVVPLALDIALLPRIFSYADKQYGGGLELEA
jgi:ABC-2 type transport system permease protein